MVFCQLVEQNVRINLTKYAHSTYICTLNFNVGGVHMLAWKQQQRGRYGRASSRLEVFIDEIREDETSICYICLVFTLLFTCI